MVMPRRGNPNWVRGVSANPGGRARSGTSLTQMIRSHVPPDEIISMWRSLMRGEPVVQDVQYIRRLHEARAAGQPDPERPASAELIYPTIDQRIAASTHLANWGYQKPAERLELVPQPEADLTQLTDDELELYERLLAKASGAAIPAASVEALPASVG